MSNGHNPFGYFPPNNPIFDMDINPNDFHTRVFARKKTQTIVKNRFFKASVNNRFFRIERQDDKPPQIAVDLNIVKHNVEQQRSKKIRASNLSNKHVLVSSKQKERFAITLKDATEKMKGFLIEELATSAFAFDSAIQEATDVLRELTTSDVSASTESVDRMFTLAVDVKAFIFMAEQLRLPQAYVDMIISKMLNQKLRTVRKEKL